MGMAFWAASFSKDPDTQMGAIIINSRGRPLGWGYNGPPGDVSDTEVDWSRPNKYDWVIHAEENAIRHSHDDLAGATLYVTGKPCKRCMLRIVSEGIKDVVYFPYVGLDPKSTLSKSQDDGVTDAIARSANVHLREFKGNLNWMRDRIKVMKKLGVFDI